MKVILFIFRIIVGAVFVASGFVKAVDPLGSCYKFTDYFNLAFDMPALADYSLLLAFVLSALEFTTGIMLIFKLKPKWAAWMSLLFMMVFLPLTLYIAIKNPVHDCGCFGDALVLDNWTTFFKNVVLTIMIIYIVIKRKYMDNPLDDRAELGISVAVFLICIVFQHMMLRHLPLFDFRPYKIGTNIAEKMAFPPDAPRDEYKTKLYYKNNFTGEVKEFDIDDENYPWNDTVTWKWQNTESVLVKKGYVPEIHDFTITDTLGNDYTEQVLNYEKPILLVIMHKIEKADEDGLRMLKELQEYATKKEYMIIGLSSSNSQIVDIARGDYQFDFPIFATDDITLKTIVRANPGIVKLEKGIVVGKWNFRDFKFNKNL